MTTLIKKYDTEAKYAALGLGTLSTGGLLQCIRSLKNSNKERDMYKNLANTYETERNQLNQYSWDRLDHMTDVILAFDKLLLNTINYTHRNNGSQDILKDYYNTRKLKFSDLTSDNPESTTIPTKQLISIKITHKPKFITLPLKQLITLYRNIQGMLNLLLNTILEHNDFFKKFTDAKDDNFHASYKKALTLTTKPIHKL